MMYTIVLRETHVQVCESSLTVKLPDGMEVGELFNMLAAAKAEKSDFPVSTRFRNKLEREGVHIDYSKYFREDTSDRKVTGIKEIIRLGR